MPGGVVLDKLYKYRLMYIDIEIVKQTEVQCSVDSTTNSIFFMQIAPFKMGRLLVPTHLISRET